MEPLLALYNCELSYLMLPGVLAATFALAYMHRLVLAFSSSSLHARYAATCKHAATATAGDGGYGGDGGGVPPPPHPPPPLPPTLAIVKSCLGLFEARIYRTRLYSDLRKMGCSG
ncbi:hypothetical protein M0804_002081 [Polistes exclamans]|nr:hypothetical protein M0804_002081 [Polistes exclamans]